jgi:hypothetical protein
MKLGLPRVLLVALMLACFGAPRGVAAHDDPVVTVRVMCDGFNVLDPDQVMGEISDSATIHVDGTIQGFQGGLQIQAWVKQQMDRDLRIEILDVGTPKRLSDGYTLDWTGRFSRQDWRAAGWPARQVFNSVVIHNGRITEWTATLDSTAAPPSASAVADDATAPDGGIPQFFGIPATLWLAAGVAITGAVLVVRAGSRR